MAPSVFTFSSSRSYLFYLSPANDPWKEPKYVAPLFDDKSCA
jgi:hypothetical protein